MKKLFILALLMVVLVVASVAVAADGSGPYQTQLTGRNEVPSVRTQAEGKANFVLSEDGLTLHYTLGVLQLEDTLQGHIHLGPAGMNGPIVVFLYPDAPPPVLIPGFFSGVLAQGEITADDLLGPMAGMTILDLVAQMEAGQTYVNVHTVENPGGEIRGQIR